MSLATTSSSRSLARAPAQLEVDILLACYQHRFLSAAQVHRLFTPTKSARWTRQVMTQLEAAGMLAKYRRRNNEALWFVTEEGRATAQLGDLPARPYRVTWEVVAGPLQAHTLALNEAMTTFVEAARSGGHECGPFHWEHEVAYRQAARPTGGKASDLVIADAVLDFTVREGSEEAHLTRFIELDRATTSALRLVAKLRTYAELRRYKPKDGPPEWRRRHLAFPRVIVVLADKPEAVLTQRVASVSALCRHDQAIAAVAGDLGLSFTTLNQLQLRGPLAPVFTRPFGPDHPVDLLGRP